MSADVDPTHSHGASTVPNLADERISVNMTPREAHNFILKLSNDDEFRSRFEKDPAGVLAEHHIYIPLQQIPAHTVLPAKDVLQRALADFTQAGELNLTTFPPNEPIGPLVVLCFWWLYLTPARPPHHQ